MGYLGPQYTGFPNLSSNSKIQISLNQFKLFTYNAYLVLEIKKKKSLRVCMWMYVPLPLDAIPEEGP